MTTPEVPNMTELIENEKNKTDVKCTHCDSLILKPASARYVESEYDLPEPHAKKRSTTAGGPVEFACETLKDFWVVNDMFTFENIGFSRTVDNTKYLICADCEIGPVGYHDLQTKRCYIALQRVKHVV
ncbi:guanine nucleotide exchange factor MSS4 homolog [Toxorhynchites rutilus septentrionalis]|uniref:guanine nucleotide exchange factor MSS4 homolog n=1 Tax=Toxorhynchites rutilus septentrionalis TaxID=329112 RepID=UPI002478C2EC|nr:guanine nucleotide exchange factor MSS4 homolog [Toxorhynchites rutilus septentrionalis]